MIVWRLAEERYARDLSGTGSKITGGRWNGVGQPVLYASEHLSLAALETVVHAPRLIQDRFLGRTALQISVPDGVEVKAVASLPHALTSPELAIWCREQGEAWINGAKALLLRVPSVIVREEFNVIINCSHPDMKHVRIAAMRPFEFDARLFR